MYKDKDRQREANRERQRRYKAKQKALPEGVTSEGVTGQGVTGIVAGYPDPVFTQLLAKADPAVCRPVSKPGDADYVPMCEVETDAY